MSFWKILECLILNLADPISSNVKTQFGEDRGFLSENDYVRVVGKLHKNPRGSTIHSLCNLPISWSRSAMVLLMAHEVRCFTNGSNGDFPMLNCARGYHMLHVCCKNISNGLKTWPSHVTSSNCIMLCLTLIGHIHLYHNFIYRWFLQISHPSCLYMFILYNII